MPTRRGIAVLIGGLVLAGCGYGFGYPELVALGVAAVAGFLIALGWAGAPVALEVRRVVERSRVVRGELCQAELDVRSTARWRSQALTGMERMTRAGAPATPVPVPPIRLRPGARTFLLYPLPTAERGVVDVGPLEISRRDPLGLVATTRRYGDLVRIWVHPRTHPIQTVPVGASRSLDGVVDAAQYGSITFHALREYVPGDDLRHVHWRTSAHVGELMVRQHIETSVPRIVVLLDDRADAYPSPEVFEEAVESAASVVVAALRAELHVELHLVSGRCVHPGIGGDLGTGPYLDLLAEARREPTAVLSAAVRRLRARHRGDTLVMLTGAVPSAATGSAPTGSVATGSAATGSVPTGSAAIGPRATGSRAAGLAQLAALRDVYPTVVAGVLGEHSVAAQSDTAGIIVIPAATAAEFATRWDGVGRW